MHVPGRVRVGAAWLLAVPFLLFSRPTLASIVGGGALALMGLVLRAWAAGTIDKDRELATSGPYAHTRNPMYVGSFVIGVGLGAAGGHWIWPLAFVVLFVAIYVPTMSREHRELAAAFGARFAEYAAHVPAFVPRLTPHGAVPAASGFGWDRYVRHREWEASLGVAAALAVLAIRMSLTS